MPTTSRPSHAPVPSPRSAPHLRLEDWLTVIVMGAALITFANVIVRYFTIVVRLDGREISVFLMIALALVAGSAAVARDQHIRIEFFCQSGSALRRRRRLAIGAPASPCCSGSLPCSACVWCGTTTVWRNLAGHRRAPVVVFDLAARPVIADSRHAPWACLVRRAARDQRRSRG